MRPSRNSISNRIARQKGMPFAEPGILVSVVVLCRMVTSPFMPVAGC